MEFSAQLDAAVEAARKAAAFIRREMDVLEREHIEEKGVHDIVTYVDEEAQRSILELLNSRFPSYGVLAEEGEASRGKYGSYDGYRWIIDPLDGTTNFTHALPPFAVSIGLQKGSEIVAGVVIEVTRDDLFSAAKGGGLYVNGEHRGVSSERSLKRSLITTGFPFRYFDYVSGYLETLHGFMYEAQGVRRPGSAAVDFAYLACGKFEGFFESGLSPWDIAAGSLLVKEAGGTVTDFDGGDAYLFEGNVLASNGLIHDDMLRISEPMRRTIAEKATQS